MTACVNKNHGRRVAGVVTASLVGALTLGGVSLAAVPTVALAEQGAGLQFAQGGNNGSEFTNGTATLSFAPAKGNSADAIVANKDAHGNVTVTADQIPFTATVTTVTPAGSNDLESVEPGTNYKVSLYKADKDGNPTGSPLSGNRVLEAGDYVVTAQALSGSKFEGQTFKGAFKVVGAQLPNVTPYENGVASDQQFVYTGSELNLGFKDSATGKKLVEGTDYTVSYTNVANGKSTDKVTDAGNYTATLTGKGVYEGSSVTTGSFSVAAFTFNNDTQIVVAPFTGALPQHPTSVYDPDTNTYLDPSLVGLVGPSTGVSQSGIYNHIQAKFDTTTGNIAGTAPDVSATKADAFGDFRYNGKALEESYEVFPEEDDFDPSSVKAAFDGKTLGNATVHFSGDVSTATGKHKITFWYTYTDDNGQVIAASKTVTVQYWDGKLDADKDLYVYFNDETPSITSYDAAYSGDSISAGNFFVTNKDQSANSIDGQLKLALKDSKGNVVDSATDAGEYTLEVTSDSYKLSGTTTLKVTIKAVDLSTLKVGALQKWNSVAGEQYLPLTYVDTDNDGKADSVKAYVVGSNASAVSSLKLVWGDKGQYALPDNADVTVEYNDNGTWKPVAKIDKAGEYRVSVTVGDDVKANYTGEAKLDPFQAESKSKFSDVQPSDWFYEPVNDAAANQYMNGYSGTTVFGPNDPITRGQVAAVLFNMSGVKVSNPDYGKFDESDSSYNKDLGWKTGFSDVDGEDGYSNAYYAQAVYWAKKTGVVNGYGDGTFQPERTVSREELVSMLANYAKVVNRDTKVDSADQSVLDKFGDAGQVDGWARQNFAWAVSQKVAGNGGFLNADGTVTRAEAAAMAVNYQPKAK